MGGTYKPHAQFLCLKALSWVEAQWHLFCERKKINASSFRSFSSVLLYIFFLYWGVVYSIYEIILAFPLSSDGRIEALYTFFLNCVPGSMLIFFPCVSISCSWQLYFLGICARMEYNQACYFSACNVVVLKQLQFILP